jgi:hypothetical protein
VDNPCSADDRAAAADLERRRGAGTTNHCVHGAEVRVEEILDWRPIDYVTTRTTLPNGFKVVSTFAFEDAPAGTVHTAACPAGATRRGPRLLRPLVAPGPWLHRLAMQAVQRALTRIGGGEDPYTA